jgi:hypothetical protein
MLFDLRSRGRRTMVRVIYVILALVMLSGLILVGVGTGNNNGGLLNAFTNNGSGGGSSQNKVITAQTTKALKAVKKSPDSAAAWRQLVLARFTQAGSGSNYNSTTSTYTKGGTAQLKLALTAWNKYLALTHDKPSLQIAELAAKAGGRTSNWTAASDAWQYVAAAETGLGAAKAFQCLAFSAYAGSNSETGDLAAAKAVSKAPKLDKLELKSAFKSAKKTPTTAQEYVTAEC